LTEDPSFVPNGLSVDDISPYPYIAKKVFGDARYDWLIVAVNMRAAFARKDTVERIRKLSYLGSSFSFISSEITAGRFYVPEDPSTIVSNIERSIRGGGISQTIIEALDTTGLLFFFGDKDVNSDTLDPGISSEAGMLAAILSTIDPETATMDPKMLSSNVSSAIKQLSLAGKFTLARPGEIILPDSDHSTDMTFADTAVQFSSDLYENNVSLIDLTTFTGLSRLVRSVRTYYDFGRSRT
jgi:hypothetical protein